jgi:hypothetical protein
MHRPSRRDLIKRLGVAAASTTMAPFVSAGSQSGVAAVEASARQYVPAADHAWEKRFPRIFRMTDGTMETPGLGEPGLAAVEGS